MIIIVGLGNPGEKFNHTRHNVGFKVLDSFAKENNFENFTLQKKFNAEILESEINNEKLILVKPQTFMNESGKAVKKIISLCRSRESGNPELVVIHDDIDLPVGKIKIVKDRGSAGHKGVESIIKEIGSSDFIRFRVGIDSPRTHVPVHGTIKAKDIVLKKFSPEEKPLVSQAIKKASDALNYFIENGLEKTMTEYNR